MKENIKPTFVLTVICVIASLLLVFAYELTKDSIAKQQEAKFSSSVELLFGKCDYKLSDTTYGNDEIKNIAVTSDGRTAFEICVDGYSKGGIDVLIGINQDGKISGIEFVSLGETPGLGSKVCDIPSFREQFIGASDDSYQFDAISGATFSSKGMKHAVDTVLGIYNDNKEAILNG